MPVVYILKGYGFWVDGEWDIVDVYSSREKAQAALDDWVNNRNVSVHDLKIEEHEVK